MRKSIRAAWLLALAVAGVALASPQVAQAHCQIPCGIYDDHARVHMMLEDAATIEKSATLIAELSGKLDAQSQNQLVRWVTNKDLHAQKVIETISDYFLTQRVKPTQADYADRLQKHHAVILAAMACKQNADVSYATALKESIDALLAFYPDH